MIPGKIFTGFAEFQGRRYTRYNTKTMTKTKKALSLLETVHERADCSKYASALGTDDNDVPSVTSSTIRDDGDDGDDDDGGDDGAEWP